MAWYDKEPMTGVWPSSTPRNCVGALMLAVLVFLGGCAWIARSYTDDDRRYLQPWLKSNVYAYIGVEQTTFSAITGSTELPLPVAAVRAETNWFYRRQLAFLWWVSLASGGLLLVLAPFAIRKDLKVAKRNRLGRQTTPPWTVTPTEFNHAMHSGTDGFEIPQVTGGIRIPFRHEPIFQRPAPSIWIPADTDPHIMLEGKTRQGKSVLMHYHLDYAAKRGHTCVVYDPNGDFFRAHGNAARGDLQLNVLSKDMPLWNLGNEILRWGESAAMAEALFPHAPHESNPFFTNAARSIFRFMLEHRPTTWQIAGWMGDRDYILQLINNRDIEVDPASLADIMAEGAPAQAGGVMAQLNMAADMFRLCPREPTNGEWSATDWALQRQQTGSAPWLFLTNTQQTRPYLVILQTLWLNTIINRVLEFEGPKINVYGGEGQVNIYGDEIDTMRKMPALADLVFRGGKHNVQAIIGYQNFGQFETIYGDKLAASIASQPATKVFLNTNEARTAERVASEIGKVDYEYVKVTKSSKGGISKTLEVRKDEFLVKPAQITTAPKMHGWMKHGQYVVPLQFTFKKRPQVHHGILPLDIMPSRAIPEKVDPFAEREAEAPSTPFLLFGKRTDRPEPVADPVHDPIHPEG